MAELRELYRAAEARAARMRLLSGIGKTLSDASPETMAAALDDCAERLAFFLGGRGGRLAPHDALHGIAIRAPGEESVLARIAIEGIGNEREIADDEDRETLALALELMGSALDRTNREQERQRLVDTLQEREKRLEMLVERMFTAQEAERLGVSRELHDGVAQTATALARMIEGAGSSAEDLPAAERAKLAGIARGLVRELRAVIGGLRPTLLDDLGLEAAIRAMADGLQAEGFTVTVRTSQPVGRLPKIVETALFRVAQEAISNIRKHSGGPCAVAIEMALAESEAEPFLRIVDSGRGSGAAVRQDDGEGYHIGIDVMTERMAAIGGRLDWRAGAKGGVSVTAFLAGRDGR
ncbi:histidine kinase [Parerythrobacter aurantius]|uniref:sensor histidine kinase n=1 Tax=Parerythrobacter aurantius TaxID=3127706 RepID=UPI00324DA120